MALRKRASSSAIGICLPRLVALLIVAHGIGLGLAVAGECDGRYLAIDDDGREYAVQRPARKFAEMLEKAKAGDSLERRKLAMSYDAGYLVSRCHAKAVYWYGKAAESGDEIAQRWLARNAAFEALRAGPECIAESCAGSNSAESRVAVLYANASRGNHYFAPLTINGRTFQGMIDTGASTVAMSAEMAKKYGIGSAGGKSGLSSTANGSITTTQVTVALIDVAGIKLRNVPVSIGISDGILIGMSFLSRVDISTGSGTMTLSKRQ